MKDRIIKVLSNLHPEVDFNAVQDNLVTDGVIDSFDIVQIISDLEREFLISISALDLIPEHFESIDDISNLVKKYQA